MKSESGIYIREAFVKRHPVCYVKKHSDDFQDKSWGSNRLKIMWNGRKKSHKINCSR